ncbi:MAG: glutamate racemase [Bacilli bacterium]|jgi:glutamate racemase|nr:glutamate racemase [Bacilli bacterium]MDD3348534.1 glutamate racemase [Bacilli bacterium]MDD4056719.1 glutamate racemase [Bacilli bacterium]MDY0208639.1 glutamate racemase [Bacilli bacterium]
MRNNKPIGVFDSGIGGMTVLSKLAEVFPCEDFIYVGDTLNCPYGVKSPEEIADLVTRVVHYLLSQDVKAIVIACNTATANSAHLKAFVKIPVVGVIEPTAKYALKTSRNKNIAVLATNATIDSKSYHKLIDKKRIVKRGKKYFVKCSEFVTAIEDKQFTNDYSFKLVKDKLEFLSDKNIDTVVLGCTHFGLYTQEISRVLPQAKLVDCGGPTSQLLKKIIKKEGLMADDFHTGTIRIATTGDPKQMEQQIDWFDKEYQGIFKVNI